MFKSSHLFMRWCLLSPLFLLIYGCQSTPPLPAQFMTSSNVLESQMPFKRLSSTKICSQTSCEDQRVTSAEILAASDDGMTLVYTDSPRNSIGIFDITDPSTPVGLGRMTLAGEPTSVAVKDGYALVTIDTSTEPGVLSGQLVVVDIDMQEVINTFELPGQPDSIALSPDKNYGAIAIENERSFSINSGNLPQAPAGLVVTLNLTKPEPKSWRLTPVAVTGLATNFPEDPEPEYVDINSANQAVVTLQENNHLVVIDLVTSEIISHFEAGMATVRIPTRSASTRLDRQITAQRQPDGVSWLAENYIVTADEGEFFGGTDTVTIFDKSGVQIWSSSEDVRRVIQLVDRENRTGESGAQPENVEVAQFSNDVTYLFANIERGDIVMVYDVTNPTEPVLVQVLDTPKGPEGGLAIPSRGLFLVASEDDQPSIDERAQIHIFSLN